MRIIKAICLVLLSFNLGPLFAKTSDEVTDQNSMPCQRVLQTESVDGPARVTRPRRPYFDVNPQDIIAGETFDDYTHESDAIDPGDF